MVSDIYGSARLPVPTLVKGGDQKGDTNHLRYGAVSLNRVCRVFRVMQVIASLSIRRNL